MVKKFVLIRKIGKRSMKAPKKVKSESWLMLGITRKMSISFKRLEKESLKMIVLNSNLGKSEERLDEEINFSDLKEEKESLKWKNLKLGRKLMCEICIVRTLFKTYSVKRNYRD